MKTNIYSNLLFLIAIILIASCTKKNDDQAKIIDLEDFCAITPDGWECEVVTSNFSLSNIPAKTETPIAIVKYINLNVTFTRYDNAKINPSLKLDFYPIEKKDALIEFIKSQQLYSWCIPMYYGETEDYFILTSPCFINGGAFTDEANESISDLHEALKSIIMVNDYK